MGRYKGWNGVNVKEPQVAQRGWKAGSLAGNGWRQARPPTLN